MAAAYGGRRFIPHRLDPGDVAGRPGPRGAPDRSRARRAGPPADRMASLPSLWGLIAEQGLCSAPDDQPIWADPVATTHRPLSSELCDRTGGAPGRGAGGAAASADERGAAGAGVCLGRLGPVCDCGALAGLVLWERGQPASGVGPNLAKPQKLAKAIQSDSPTG